MDDQTASGEEPVSVPWLTDKTFEEFIRSSESTVVYFWADTPVATETMDPSIDELAGRHADRVSFGRVNVDDEPVLAAIHEVLSIPTLVVFKDGEVKGRLVGAMSTDKLDDKLSTFL